MQLTSFACLLAAQITASSFSIGIPETPNYFTANVPSGSTMQVEIRGNPTTGYAWSYTPLESSNLLTHKDTAYERDQLQLMGSGGVYKFTFEIPASAKGAQELVFVNARSWEPVPIRTVTLKVTIG